MATVTRPAPMRSAPRPRSTAAPDLPMEPAHGQQVAVVALVRTDVPRRDQGPHGLSVDPLDLGMLRPRPRSRGSRWGSLSSGRREGKPARPPAGASAGTTCRCDRRRRRCPATSGDSASSPEGMSTETTSVAESFTSRMTSVSRPRTPPVIPVPSRASTTITGRSRKPRTRAHVAPSATSSTISPLPRAAWKLIAASPVSSAP